MHQSTTCEQQGETSMPTKEALATALLSDMGRVRTNNEDAVGEDGEVGLLVLADGMGGYNAGEIASGITVATVLDTIKKHWKDIKHGELDVRSGLFAEATLLQQAIEAAHTTIYHVSQNQPQCAGMGTTVVACVFHGYQLSIAYVGDSRLYRFRAGQLVQITRDHSLLEELIARGHYTREEASKLVRKNIVTRALGVEPEVAVELMEETTQTGDIILLCSDGLTDMVSDEIIESVLNQYSQSLPEAARVLVNTANENGGKDNVTVALARVDAAFTGNKSWYEKLTKWF
jgi:protein phosphatase